MSPQRRWWLGALGSMIALAAIGSWGCCSVTCCDKQPRNQLILVSDVDADWGNIKEVVIRKSLNQEIVWKLTEHSTITYIEIMPRKPSTPDTPPFEKCITNVKPCQIACKDGLCPSGAINPALNPPRKGLYYYDYTFARSASRASADPGFRIDP